MDGLKPEQIHALRQNDFIRESYGKEEIVRGAMQEFKFFQGVRWAAGASVILWGAIWALYEYCR